MSRYSFLTRHYDERAALYRQYVLNFFLEDNSVELFDMKSKKLFLRRTQYPKLQQNALFIGNRVNIYGRQLEIMDFGDQATRRLFATTDCGALIVLPHAYHSLPELINRIGQQLQMIDIFSFECNDEIVKELLSDQTPRNLQTRMEVFRGHCHCVVVKGTKSQEVLESIASHLIADFGFDSRHYGYHVIPQLRFDADVSFVKKAPSGVKHRNSTCVVIKPHAFLQNFAGPIMNDLMGSAFRITAIRTLVLEPTHAYEFLEVYRNVLPYYEEIHQELINGPCIAMEVQLPEGTNRDVVSTIRQFVGPRDSEIAKKVAPDSIRAKYGVDHVLNAVHTTDLEEDGFTDIEYLFKVL
ncbi:hypothetical protein PCE1_002276 [Barthelona sp. PCE]